MFIVCISNKHVVCFLILLEAIGCGRRRACRQPYASVPQADGHATAGRGQLGRAGRDGGGDGNLRHAVRVDDRRRGEDQVPDATTRQRQAVGALRRGGWLAHPRPLSVHHTSE